MHNCLSLQNIKYADLWFWPLQHVLELASLSNSGSWNKLRSLRLNKLTVPYPPLLFKSVIFKEHFDVFVQYKHKERLSYIRHSTDLFFSFICIWIPSMFPADSNHRIFLFLVWLKFKKCKASSVLCSFSWGRYLLQ